MNKVILVGNLGKDPELKATNKGHRYALVSMATSESWKDKTTGEKKERVSWHRVVCWGDGLCDVIDKYAKKGGKVLVEGKLSTQQYEKDGEKRYLTQIVVQGPDCTFRLLNRPGEGSSLPPLQEPDRWNDDAGAPASRSDYTDQPMDQEIPF